MDFGKLLNSFGNPLCLWYASFSSHFLKNIPINLRDKKTLKKVIQVLMICLVFLSCDKQKTEVILLGTVHSPIENFNEDSLFNILIQIKPDVILYEVDSSFFTSDFEFEKELSSNEYNATVKYQKEIGIILRPYDFTGRNEHRKRIGSRPADSKTLQDLDSLYKNQLLSKSQNKIYREYLSINKDLAELVYLGAKTYNSSSTDSIAKIRQEYQYRKLLEIVDEIPLFADK